MRNTISQFMWGYQPLFRVSLEGTAARALEYIGADLAPEAFLVGFRVAGERWPICIEPERGPFQPHDLEAVPEEGRRRYDASEERHMIHSDRRVHEARHAGLRNRERARALEAALAATPAGAGRTFIAGYSVRVGDYEVHPVLAINAINFAALPRLTTTTRNRMPMTVSLADGVIGEVLRIATKALRMTEPPDDLTVVSDEPADDAVRRAANRLVHSAVVLSGELFGHALYPSLDRLSTSSYEGRVGTGALLVVADGHNCVDMAIRLRDRVSLGAGRQLRKLLEMSGPGLDLITDGQDVYALGSLGDGYEPAREDAFHGRIVGRGTWELLHAGTPLLRVEHGRPLLPRPRMSRKTFADTMRRVFATAAEADVERVWHLAQAASGQAHGTMLVVSAAASGEAQRLSPQVLAIEPQRLDDAALRPLTSIDGAVLLAPDGTCHGVGVILDGSATGTGDPGRGARYNSAVRYLAASTAPCMIVIVSEDGMIDVLPELAPRVRRLDVEEALAAIEEAGSGTEIDFEVFYKCRQRVEALAFYLNAEQCERANQVSEHVEDIRWQQNSMRIGIALFVPDPRMNDEYFLE